MPLDWKLAQDTAARLARPGPKASLIVRTELVSDLRRAATTAVDIVAETTQLDPATDADVRVVDRANWSRSVIAGLSTMIGEAIPVTSPMTARGAGQEVGGHIAILASRVLGHYDPWSRPEQGSLTLVAPTLMATERPLQANPHALHTLVCLPDKT